MHVAAAEASRGVREAGPTAPQTLAGLRSCNLSCCWITRLLSCQTSCPKSADAPLPPPPQTLSARSTPFAAAPLLVIGSEIYLSSTSRPLLRPIWSTSSFDVSRPGTKINRPDQVRTAVFASIPLPTLAECDLMSEVVLPQLELQSSASTGYGATE